MSHPVSPRARWLAPSTVAVAVCALGALIAAPSALAAPSPTPTVSSKISGATTQLQSGHMSVGGANLAKVADKYGMTRAQVAARQTALAPIIAALAPATKQPTALPKLKVTMAAQAKPDACFRTMGEDAPPIDANGNCPAGYIPKYNQGYVYGSTVAGNNFFFGTLTNAVCAGGSAFFANTQPFQTENVACEGPGGPNGREFGWPSSLGAFARSQVWRVDSDTNQSYNITPTDEQAPYFKWGSGVRGGGSKDGVTLMVQTIFQPDGRGYRGVELLAYNSDNGDFLGETLMPQYFNMRNGQIINGELYFGVRAAGTGAGSGGGIIKWTGSKADPFSFETVASGLTSEPAYLVLHEGHLVSSGWTTLAQKKTPETAMAEIYLGPVVPQHGGLTSATADPSNWKSIFKMSDLEPDPVIARAINFGDIASFQGKLVFSTYSYAGYNTSNAFAYYGEPTDDVGKLNTLINAERPLSVMEMTDVTKPKPKVRLLYGEAKLPVFNTSNGTWQLKNNKLNQTPEYGSAGFGNRFNTYSWMWTQYKGSLYMGTFDVSSAAQDIVRGYNPALLNLSPLTLDLLQPVLQLVHNVQGGADVWRFDNINRPAVPETTDGFGNRNFHGVRAWGAFPDKNKLYVGMTSWRNLKEGWQLNALLG